MKAPGSQHAVAAELIELVAALRRSAGIAHKRDINDVIRSLGAQNGETIRLGGTCNDSITAATSATTEPSVTIGIGDDCAAIPDGDGYLLFAIEGMINQFVTERPWFAGYCGVMVNVSDIYAMGGRPTAIVDAIWSRDGDAAHPILEGIAEASRVYQVPVVGGHSNRRNDREQLSVAILGRAKRLLTSFDAKPGQHLVAAIDLRGKFEEPDSYWNASTAAPPARLRGDLELLPAIAEAGLSAAGKDISMAGIVGTALMLLECSGVGAVIDLDRIPRPADIPLLRWLNMFPSYGFLLSVDEDALPEVLGRFAERDIAAAGIGRIDGSKILQLERLGTRQPFWDLNTEALIGCGIAATEPAA